MVEDDLAALALPACDRALLVEKLLSGGFPEAVARTSAKRRAAWFESYLQTILQRDVRELANLAQLTEVPHLLQLLATRSASLLNQAELSRASRLTQTTLKRYLSLLETLFLMLRVPAWARNPGKRLVKSPKVFLPDTGLLAWLMDYTEEKLLALPGLPGSLVETFVAGELLKHLAFSAKGLSLWHYRTQTDIEVDFVLEDRLGRLTGIDVKASASIDGRDFNGLRHLQETEGEAFCRGIVFYSGREVVAFSERLFALPLSFFGAGKT